MTEPTGDAASAAADGGTTPRLSCRGVTVRFGGVVAVDDVDLVVPQDAIVGLVGPNGAGKSTLFGVLSGLVRPTSGRVFLDGDDVTRSRPQCRAERGLARTFQHPELFAGLTVREHLVLAHRARAHPRRVWTDLFTMGSLHGVDPAERDGVDRLVDLLELRDLAHRPAVGLPLGSARLVELGRALATAPRVLLLDEPSSGLDSSDTARFESTLRRVAHESGISVLLVEHDVDLVMRMCSTVNVLDFGQLIASAPPAAIRVDDRVRAAYLGEPETAKVSVPPGSGDAERGRPAHGAVAAGRPLLRVRDLSVRYGEATALSGVSFEVAKGEAVAVLGPNGAGKSSLARAITGLVRPSGGAVELDGSDLAGVPGHRVRRQGVLHLPEGRGIFGSLTVADNLRMAVGVLPRRRRAEAVDSALSVFPILAARRRQPAGLLSGGEQQMLSLARALATSPVLLVADELSLGLAPIMVDLVFDGLSRARDEGVTVVMIEQYVHRALGFADRCIVLQRGKVAWSGEAGAAGDAMLRHYLGDGLIATA